ncbi:MAG: hypothetical protein ABI208_06800 [Ginsengibacter sp.]
MPVTPQSTMSSDTMNRWNQFIAYAKQKGYSGMPQLDHDENLRQKVFKEYNAAHPNSQVDYSMVKDVQNEIQNYKQKALQAIKGGSASLSDGANQNNFMSGISPVDGIFGSKTSSWQFPSAYMNKKRLGFAPKVDMTKALSSSN